MKHRLVPRVTVAAIIFAGPLVGCTAEAKPDSELPGFDSIDEAFNAVDSVLECEANPVGEPTLPMGESGPLTTEQRLCAEYVQVDLYPDADSLKESFEIWSGTNQGQVHLVRGKNWLVVDGTDIATGETTGWDLEGLAEELGGEYTLAGPG